MLAVSLPKLASSMPCEICRAGALTKSFEAIDRLHSTPGTFEIYECDHCRSLRCLPPATPSEISAFYPIDYYTRTGALPPEAMAGLGRRWRRRPWVRNRLSAFSGAAVSRGAWLLDLGGGSGGTSLLASRAGYKAILVDIAPSRPLVDESGILPVKADIECLPFRDGSVQLVGMWHSLEHTENPRAAIAEASRVLRPEGTFVIEVPNPTGFLARLFQTNWFALEAPRHRYLLSPLALTSLAREFGLTLVGTEHVPDSASFIGSFIYRQHGTMSESPRGVAGVGFPARVLAIAFTSILSRLRCSDTVSFTLQRAGAPEDA